MPSFFSDLALRLRLIERGRRYKYRTERNCTKFLFDHLKEGQTAIDIGAHKAAFTYWMMKTVGRSGRVVAVEPITTLAAYLRDVARIYRQYRIDVIEAALSDAAGERDLYIPHGGYWGTSGFTPRGNSETFDVERVKTIPLDALCQQIDCRPVHFIKCDVEGHELEVFESGEKVLREDRPVLLFECEDWRNDGGQTERVLPYLLDLGYDGYFFQGEKVRPLAEFRVEEHQQMDEDKESWRPTEENWCPNFGFLPKR
jgi:FkbM family methyltransferase